MKMKNNNFLLALLVIFISSCEPLELQSPFPVQMQESNTDLLAVSKSSLIIEPESFIADQQDRVISTALNGPIIDVQSSELAIAKNSIRKQINKEEVKNNIDVSSGTQKEEIFPISVNFENIPIEYMSVMFSEISGRNIMIGDEVSGLVSAKLNNVPWDKALDSILKVKQLAKYVDEEANIIRIHSQEVLAAQEKYDLEIMQAMEKTRNAHDAVQPIYTEIFNLYYT
jgi:type IV pilus assembly protein PilQ